MGCILFIYIMPFRIYKPDSLWNKRNKREIPPEFHVDKIRSIIKLIKLNIGWEAHIVRYKVKKYNGFIISYFENLRISPTIGLKSSDLIGPLNLMWSIWIKPSLVIH